MNVHQGDRLSIIQPRRGPFYLGLALSVIAHLAVVSFFLAPREQIEERVVARFEWVEEETAFFNPAPQLVREFAFKKQPVPEGTPVVRTSGDQTSTTVGGSGAVRMAAVTSAMWSRTGGSADFVVDIAGAAGVGEVVVGLPKFEAISLQSLKEPEKRIDMEAEFLDLSALNTGKYKGMVIQDPTDKSNITGFVYLGLAWGSILEPSRKRSLTQLARWINNWTRIEARVDDQMYLDSKDLFRAPFVYITTSSAFELTKHELKNVAAYLQSGGFIVADNDNPRAEYGPGEASLRDMFKKALGRNARFVPLPNDHPIYHVFFDFNGGPPPGGDAGGGTTQIRSHWLEGIYLGDRLAVVYSDKGYGAFWEREIDNEPQLKFGVNLVVFALTQKGSIAQQQIDFYGQATR